MRAYSGVLVPKTTLSRLSKLAVHGSPRAARFGCGARAAAPASTAEIAHRPERKQMAVAGVTIAALLGAAAVAVVLVRRGAATTAGTI